MDIVWRRTALDDLESARYYIAERNQRAAARIHAAILASVGRLANHPNLGRPVGSPVRANWSSRERPTSSPMRCWTGRS